MDHMAFSSRGPKPAMSPLDAYMAVLALIKNAKRPLPPFSPPLSLSTPSSSSAPPAGSMGVWPLCTPAMSARVHRLLCLGPAWCSVAGTPSDQDLLWYLMAVRAACLATECMEARRGGHQARPRGG